MIGLVEAHGELCMLADIKSVQHVDRVPGRAEHYLLRRHTGSASLTLFAHEFAEFEARPVQIMAASPGTNLVSIFGGLSADEEPIADKTPILAWALCIDGQVRPVTPAGVSRGYSPTSNRDWYPEYVEMADGSLYQFGYDAEQGAYPSVEAVIEREARRQRSYEAERQQRADILGGGDKA